MESSNLAIGSQAATAIHGLTGYLVINLTLRSFNYQFYQFLKPRFRIQNTFWHETPSYLVLASPIEALLFSIHSLISHVFFGSHHFISQLLMQPFNGLV